MSHLKRKDFKEWVERISYSRIGRLGSNKGTNPSLAQKRIDHRKAKEIAKWIKDGEL